MKLPVSVPLQRSFAVLTWERAVPAFLPLAVAASVVFALLWTGAYAFLPPLWHAAALTISAAVLLFLAAWGGRRFRFPKRGETLRRIEERSNLRPGILDGVYARPFEGEETAPLWIASRERLLQSVGSPKAPLPRLPLRKIDPYWLRYLALALVAGSLLLTLGRMDGLRASLDPGFVYDEPVMVAAWIEPPAYTGLRPQTVDLNRANANLGLAAGSVLHVKLEDPSGRRARGVLTLRDEEGRRTRLRPSGEENGYDLELTENTLLQINARGRSSLVRLLVRPDQVPQVRLVGEPETATGLVRLDVETVDDFPLKEGRLILSLLPGQRISPDAPAVERDIAEEPQIISLPELAGTPGERTVEAGTEEHPWSGLLVKAELEVTDGLGQSAKSEPFAFTMPERTFYSPLSRAVIEERRKLAMAPSSLNRTSDLFAGLVEAPDLFDLRLSEHLMLKAAAEAVAAARVRDVPDLIDTLWPLAIELEDDGLALAKARLDEAEEALREALRNGASQEEIAQRIADLRQAMNDYIAALAETDYADADPDEGGPSMGQTDLEELLDQMQELAENDLRGEAEELLRQLEALLQDLQIARGGEGGQQQSGGQGQGQGGQGQPGGEGGTGGRGQQSLSGTGDILQKQRELTDRTFSARRGEEPGAGSLSGDQEALADELGALAEGLPQEGEGARENFEAAEESMRAAARALGQGRYGLAEALQERAMGQLREAGTELAEAFGEGEEGDEAATDPLGRAVAGEGARNPEDFGLYDPERIRALIEQIRQRLEQPNLSEAERDYLESLLERF
ncbi:DUF4175 domain-containing protein [Parvularcula maris]|uniref:DUF4175 domain-containing protein n=1 Tax=Parvularcula maris TaxID=2965077 RepID=A0A9X2L7L1_9PROT|nr:DUF4175 family protein [Parvularcula maris]MCQ8184535.1 DUF4175 domain-containing protein [Parvularcula maris]